MLRFAVDENPAIRKQPFASDFPQLAIITPGHGNVGFAVPGGIYHEIGARGGAVTVDPNSEVGEDVAGLDALAAGPPGLDEAALAFAPLESAAEHRGFQNPVLGEAGEHLGLVPVIDGGGVRTNRS
jgi:hypothetical protein